MQYTTTISDSSVYGITAARNAYNASIPATIDDAPNPALLQSDSAYLDFVLQAAIQSWCKQHAPVVVPEVPVTEVNGVPQQVSRRQAKTVMELTPNAAYGDIWQAAIAAANAIPDAQTRIITVNYLMESLHFEYSQVLAMAQSLLGMTATQVDALFVAADKL